MYLCWFVEVCTIKGGGQTSINRPQYNIFYLIIYWYHHIGLYPFYTETIFLNSDRFVHPHGVPSPRWVNSEKSVIVQTE